MARRARPWVRSDRGVFTVQHEGRQINLGVPGPDTPENRALAEAAYRRFLAELVSGGVVSGESSGPLTPHPSPLTTSEAAAAFLARCEVKLAAGRLGVRCLRNYRVALNPFVAAFGDRPASSLRAPEIEAWAAGRNWSPSYQNGVLGVVQMVLAGAGHPLALDRPPKESRGADTCLTDDQFALVLANLYRGNFGGDLRELLVVLRETGARPAEAAALTAELVDWDNGCARLKTHKTRRRTGKDRVIYFNTAALAVLRGQREKYLTGFLFRTRNGRAWRPNEIVKRLLVVSERVGFRVIAVGFRHAYATRALAKGVPEAVVAALLGHKGTQMLHHHYAHVGSLAGVLREAAEKVSRKE